jgi:hypothetical protein
VGDAEDEQAAERARAETTQIRYEHARVTTNG